ncbi:MAG: alanine--tRNA ligase [Flavobacteriales bacterium]|nr:MAG: alanine--tRNA ligase [Flavobacteriales bacterium]
MDSNTIRNIFIDFFKNKSHNFIKSSPIVSKNDPSLMFSNAGMNQFKSIFLGGESNVGKRVVNSQKCLRVSGKHNDLDEVGIDHYHHTMFEMLGNWSFGDYFKNEIIKWSWEILTNEYKISPDDLYVTIFEGSSEDGLQKDNEAEKYWSEIIDESRIISGNKKDNFWEMGDTGPCGPCSEIHVDLRTDEEKLKLSAVDLVNKDHPQVIELWNLVFIQFNRKSDGTLESLPEKHIDTGMGFERLARVIQKKESNYDTDIFKPIILEIEKMSGISYGSDEKSDIAIRVIADHLRAVSFCIADGQIPSNTGAGYVVRRILRRAIRYAYTFLNIEKPFIFKLVNVLSNQFKDSFNEINKQKSHIQSIIEQEEKSFLRTLSQGISRLNIIINENNSKQIDAKDVFELYDTYGFPADLTELILSEHNRTFDQSDFNLFLEEQRKRSRSSSLNQISDWTEFGDIKSSIFEGYDNLSLSSEIIKFRTVENKNIKKLEIVSSSTPFYPEGGGQIGDSGEIIINDNKKIEVFNTRKENDDIVHECSFENILSSKIELVVDNKKRKQTSSNHSATHLLHQALREVLGEHVEQRGSMVSDTGLRFDFSHFKKIEKNEIVKIEDFVNDIIDQSLNLEENRTEKYTNALKNGVIALFGEKYGDVVRTVKFGNSYELCGGTHVKNTSSIRLFKIISESSVASGIRRIEALTGNNALKLLSDHSTELNRIGELVSTNSKIYESVLSLNQSNKKLEKNIKNYQSKIVSSLTDDLIENVENFNGVNLLVSDINDFDSDNLKSLSFSLIRNIEDAFILLKCRSNNKTYLVCNMSKNLNSLHELDASTIVKEICKRIDGGGGGQQNFASGSGNLNIDSDELKNICKKYL